MTKRKDTGEWMPKGVLDEWLSKAAAYDRLVKWLDELRDVGVAGRFIAPREIRAILEGRDAE